MEEKHGNDVFLLQTFADPKVDREHIKTPLFILSLPLPYRFACALCSQSAEKLTDRLGDNAYVKDPNAVLKATTFLYGYNNF